MQLDTPDWHYVIHLFNDSFLLKKILIVIFKLIEILFFLMFQGLYQDLLYRFV